MLQPVGPLPAAVYWRRRLLALAVVLFVLLVGWLALPGGGGDGDDTRDTAGAAGSPGPSGGTPSSLAATPPSDDPGRPGQGSAGSSGGATGTGPAGPGASTTAAAAPVTPKPPQPPGPCPDTALTLRVLPERPAYQVGDTPVLDLVVRNVSTVACVRDLGPAQQEVVLYAGARRLWSSNDCYPGGTRDVQVLQPGDSASFSVTWSGLSSRPRCAGDRTRVTAGGYALVGRLGTLVSKRAPLVLR